MASDLVSIIAASGGHFTTPIAWEDEFDEWGASGAPTDLTDPAFIWQPFGSEGGTAYVGYLCTGQTSGYTGTVRYRRAGGLVLADMTVAGNNWQNGETVQRNPANSFVPNAAADTVILVGEVNGDVSIASSFTIHGYETDATNKIIVRSYGAAKRSASAAIADGSAAGRVIQTGSNTGLHIFADSGETLYVDVEDMDFYAGSTTTNLVKITGSGNVVLTLRRCILRGLGLGASAIVYNACTGTTSVINLDNCVLYGDGNRGVQVGSSSGVINARYCTVYLSHATYAMCYEETNGSLVCTNCYGGRISSSGSCFGSGVDITTCGSSDTSGSSGIQSLAAADQFNDVDSGTEDFRLQSDSGLIDEATTIGGLTTDICGTARPGGSEDVGAFEYVGAAGPPLAAIMAAYRRRR